MPPPVGGFQQPPVFPPERNNYEQQPYFSPRPPPSQYNSPPSIPYNSPTHASSPPAANYPSPVGYPGGPSPPYNSYNQMLSPAPVQSVQMTPQQVHSPSPLPSVQQKPSSSAARAVSPEQNRGNPITARKMDEFPETQHVFTEEIENEMPARNFADFVDGDKWIEIRLYELDMMDSKTFQTEDSMLWVDGYCSTNEANRFSIGSLNTPGQRSSNIRSLIGKGIRVELIDDNCVIYNEGMGTIFVQCPNYAKQNGDYSETVYRISGTGEQPNELERRVKVFDFNLFKTEFESATNPAALSQLCNMCITRISFLKGFGSKYPRQNIRECPVWIEMHMLKRLWEVDRKLENLLPAHHARSNELF